ncbi:hypothetical protein BT69DRAFT_1284842 [Atractiella rhizophila]|nr:hypothetical protein BT69DRAFT_1284842 [Atractiella rhizophila]
MLGSKKQNFLTNETEHGFLDILSPLSLFRLTGLTIDDGVLVCHSESFRSC